MSAATEPKLSPAKPSWTPEQELAITARGGNLLVSAAAGSGKTAVLVERVIRLVLGPETSGEEAGPPDLIDVDRLLVVTFTEAAATEMRDRLARALRDRLRAAETEVLAPTAARLRRQSALLGRASISTLHAFCLSVCRRHFHRLGLDPAFEVLSEEEASLLRTEVLETVFEDRYELSDDGFARLVDGYGSDRGDDPLRETVLRLHAFSRSHPDPEAWLDGAARAFDPPPETRLTDPALGFGQRVIAEMESAILAAAENLKLAEALARLPSGPEAYIPILAEDIGRLSVSARRCRRGEWAEVLAALAEAADFPDLPRVGRDQADPSVKKAVQDARGKAKKLVKELLEAYGGRSEEELLGEIRALAGPMRTLVALVTRFDIAYREAKDEHGTLDFGDLEHLCLQALGGAGADGETYPTEAARELQDRYVEVLVDEYQDTNAVQEAILTRVSRGDNLFMVGDVKQSIYRFRLADPSLFEGKSQSYLPLRPGDARPGSPDSPPAVAGLLVHLPHNFRSRRPVLDAVNFVFRQVMRKDAVEIDYGPEAELVYGAGLPDSPNGHPAVELHLVESKPEAGAPAEETDAEEPGTTDGEEGDPSGTSAGMPADTPAPEDLRVVEREAVLIASRIQEMVRGPSPLLVWDRGQRDYRPAAYRDVAVLMRATTGLANLVVETFARLGVPAHASLNTGYFTATEVETALSLLRLIDNPRQDVPLAAVLRSPVVGLDSADLARIRLSCRPGEFYDAVLAAAGRGAGSGTGAGGGTDDDPASRLKVFLDHLATWRDAARRGSLSELVWRLYGETGLYAYVGGLPGGAQRQANLRSLHDRARLFDQFSRQGLSRFLRFVDRLRESEGDLGPPPPLGEGEDAVRVMSIHRSKGLEFPVVFLPHLGKRINLADTRGDLICHRNLGLGPVVADTTRRLKYPSLANRAVARENKAETVAEELRCLYVAMTRARDALVLFGSKRGLLSALGEWCRPGEPDGGGRLAVARVAGATTYLDWLVPAVASHPAAAELRRLSGFADGVDSEDKAPEPSDPSRWDIRVWGLPGYGDSGQASERAARLATTAAKPGDAPAPSLTPEDWESIARLETLAAIPSGRVTAALNWSYPSGRLATLAAKVSPTELKRLLDSGYQEEAAVWSGDPGLLPPPPRPAFLQAAPAGPTPAERGKATHLLLQHADLGAPLDAEALAQAASGLAEREVMTPEQAQAVDVRAAARFFETDLGRWLVAARERVKREVPFTVGIPAAEVYGEFAGDSREMVLVQGIIDVLVDEPDGLTILDFKTDRVTAAEAPERAAAYQTQVALYRRAVESILGRPVKTVWLYFLTPGLAVPAGEVRPAPTAGRR